MHRAGLFIYELILDLVVIYPSQKGSLPTDPTDEFCTGLFKQVSNFQGVAGPSLYQLLDPSFYPLTSGKKTLFIFLAPKLLNSYFP